MRVIVVTESFLPARAPAATTVTHLVDRLVDHGHTPMVVAPGPGQSSFRGVEVVRTRAGDVLSLKDVLSSFDPDLVHVADPRLLGTAALHVARAEGVPTVLSAHSVSEGTTAGMWTARMRPRHSAGGHRTLVTCSAARARLAEVGVASHVWAPGVDADTFRPGLRDAEIHDRWARRHRGEDRLVVGYVGDVDRPKTRKRLAAIGALPGTRLVVIGAGDEAAKLKQSVAKAKVTGPMSSLDRARSVGSVDVVVQPRRGDSCAHGLREALACGVPVVAVSGGGADDLVRSGHHGILVDDPEAMVGAVAGLLAHPERLAGMREALATMAAPRTWDECARELVAGHYAALVDAPAAPAPGVWGQLAQST